MKCALRLGLVVDHEACQFDGSSTQSRADRMSEASRSLSPELPLNVACLGAGYFSSFHTEAWQRISEAKLVGLADLDLERARQCASGLSATPAIPVFSALEPMLEATRPDILDIIVPPSAHHSAITTALEHGMRAIICQKPFCRDLDEARDATARARNAGVPLLVHENFRFQPWYRTLKAAIDAGRIGIPMQLTFRLRPGDGQGPDAYLARQPYFQTMPRFLIHETAVHWVDTFRFLFGPPRAVYADLRRLNPAISGEDAGIVVFEMDEGRRALFDGNRHLDHAAENHRLTMGEALIEGTEGTLNLDGHGRVTHRAFGRSELEVLQAADTSGVFGGDCVYHLQSHVVRGLHGAGVLENTAEDYLQVLEIENAIYRSADEGRRIELD